MKKIKYLLLLCATAMMLTGCVKYNATMKINKDKSMDFTIIYAMDKSLMSMGGESSSLKEEDFDELKKTGFTVEKYSEENFEGFKLTKKINNIDEVSTDSDVLFSLTKMMEPSEDNKYMFKVVKDGDKSTYYAKFKFDAKDSSANSLDDEDEVSITDDELPDENDDILTTTGEDDNLTIGGSDDDFDISGFTNSMDLSFKVILPDSAISSNATSKENNDKDLTWKLNYSESKTIEFAFTIDANASDSNLILYIGIGVGVLLVLVLLIFLLTRKKGKTEVAPIKENVVEIKNDVNESVSEQLDVKEKAQVVNDEQKDA